MLFDHLDYIYTPSRDVAADVRYFTDVLGGRLVFAIEGMGARVAMIELTDEPPRILLADHLEGDVPILVYRVDSLAETVATFRAAGLDVHEFGLPPGPAARVDAPGGQPFAVYELTRPGVVEGFAGRFDED